MEERRILKLKINRARFNLMFLIILSVLNIFFICAGKGIHLPYSSAATTLLSGLAMQVKGDGGSSATVTLLLAAAGLCLLLLSLCYYFSKKHSVWMLTAMIAMVIDTFLLLIIIVTPNEDGVNLLFILDLAMHALIIFYLGSAVKAHLDYAKLPAFEGVEDRIEIKQDFGGNEAEKAEEEYDDEEEDEIIEEDGLYRSDEEEPLTTPIGKFEGDEEGALVKGSYAGLNVFVVFEDEKAKMVINGYVCDEITIGAETQSKFELRAIVNDIDFSFDYEADFGGDSMYLYADDELLDSLGRERR